MSTIYEGYSNLALTYSKDPEQAFRIIELARGRAAADALRSRQDAGSESKRERTPAEREIVKIQIQLQNVRSKERRKELLARLAEAEERQASFVKSPAGLPRYMRPDPVSVADLRRNLRPDEAILEYMLGDASSHVLFIRRNILKAYPLPARSEVNGLCQRLLDELRAKKQPAPELTRSVYSMLLGPVKAIAESKRLIVIPDGPLHLLPFDVFRGPTGRELCKTHVVSYAPSATALHVLRSRKTNATSMLPLLAVGALGVKDDVALEPKLGELQRTTRGVFDLAGSRLPPLPGTASEIRDITALFGPSAVSLLREAATEAAFKSQPLARFQILHLAVHGVSDPKFPDRSALVLGATPEKQEDGLLQVREISSLSLNADLVALSACDTGIGRLEGQEGMANLVRAFLLAGSRNVVSALWEVDDSFGAALMKRFYVHLVQGQDMAAALRLAKLDLRKRYGAVAVPFFWAPFVVVGDGGAPIQRPKSLGAGDPKP